MAAAAASSSPSQGRYDVFLSFRGEDTRNNFTAHLCEELRTKGINTFIDEEKLERGQAVSAALVSAIENSMFSIIVLSENYASSRWCLEELVKIIQCMKNSGHRVLPIFYNVDPSDVRNHMGKFGEALAKHEENSKEGMERVQIWKDALTQVTNFSGWDSRNKIMMHDLIQEMGMEIVRQESHNPGQRSRLWLHKDINDALKKNTENEKIEGIFLDLSHSQEIIDFSTQAFPRMYKLRLLKVYESNKISRNFGDTLNKENCKVHFSPNLRFCYDELRYLYLYGYSLKSLDNDFNAKNLVHLSMHYSHIKQLWKGIKVLEKLKVMDLSHSKSLIETPDFSRVPNLERLVLEGCISLHKVHPSLGVLNKLNFLSLKNCEKLKSLPSSMCDLKSLETFILSGCSRLEDFPENFGNLEMLKELHADGIPVRVLPSSFSLLRNLEILSFKGCRGPPSTSWLLPRRSSSSTGSILHHLSGLYSLTRLNLGYCNLSDETNLSSLCLLSSLEVLDLSGNNFVTLPNIRGLSSLEGLLLEKCKRLQVLPELPSSIYSLIAQDCISLENASNQVLKSLFPTTKSPKKTFKRNSGAHLIYVMVYGSRIPDWIRYQSSGCEVEADLPPNWYNSNLLGLALSFVTYVFASNVIIPVSYTLRYSTSSYIANRISIRCDKEGVGLDHVWLLYIKLPLFSNWHNGTPINWHEVTHISVSFGTQVMGWYPPIKRCGFDLVYSNDQDVNPPVIQFSSISSPPLPNKSTVVLKEIHKKEEPSGSELSNVDGSESDSSDYHTADEEEPTTAKETDRSEDHSESEMRPQKRLKCRHYEGIP